MQREIQGTIAMLIDVWKKDKHFAGYIAEHKIDNIMIAIYNINYKDKYFFILSRVKSEGCAFQTSSLRHQVKIRKDVITVVLVVSLMYRVMKLCSEVLS